MSKINIYQDKFWATINAPMRLNFKISALGILFLLVYIRIFDVLSKVQPPTLRTETYLYTALIIVIYLWVADSVDTQRSAVSSSELERVQNKLMEDHINTIAALILSQEAKDPYSRGHSDRVTQYALLLAKKLNLSEQETEVLERAAKLHDIGKIGITDLILTKIAKLSKEEMDIIRTHSDVGDNILKPLKFLKNERVLIRQHHERYDGRGYPDRLEGEDIFFGARILSICDFYDAVSSDRIYRKALSNAEIVRELKNNRGKQFDPGLVDLLLEIIGKEKNTLNKIAESAR